MRGAFFLSNGRSIELGAVTPMSAGSSRSLARCIWTASASVPPALGRQAAQLAEQTPASPGRVHGLGHFQDEGARRVLNACLPAQLAAALRGQFEWYGCRGAGFHTDAHYPSVLFGAWHLAGPARDIVFADPWLRVACASGELVVFDPFQPHAVLDPGEERYRRDRYAEAAASVFLGFELELTAAVRQQFGIGPAEPGALSISSATAVNAETGRIER
jgi:hypothetical protein